jgi:hypothetical protein
MPPYGAIPTFGGARSTSTNAASSGAAAMGGTSSIDAGAPGAVGGRFIIIYGAIGVYGLRSL